MKIPQVDFSKWGKDMEPPPEYITKEEVQEMIDTAIRRHNRNAVMISMFVGFFIVREIFF